MAIQINGTDVIDNSRNIVNAKDAKMTGTVVSKQTAFAYAMAEYNGNFLDKYNFSNCNRYAKGRLTFTFSTKPAGGNTNARNYTVLVQPDSSNPFDVSRVFSKSDSGFSVASYNTQGTSSQPGFQTDKDLDVCVIVFTDAAR